MTKITQKQLIEQVRTLKEIKPRKEWAVLLKSQILSERKDAVIEAKSVGFMDVISLIFAPKKLAYAFTAGLVLIIGILGFARYTMPGDLLFPARKIAEQSQAALTGQTGLKQDAAVLSSRINDLAQVAKAGKMDNIPSAISEINANALELSKNLKNNTVNDPQTIKDIANSLKVLADVPGTDLTGSPDVKDLYQTVVQSQIADLNKTTLTDGQNSTLNEVKDLYDQGKYTDALEKILLINK
jgi:hypothetical protein